MLSTFRGSGRHGHARTHTHPCNRELQLFCRGLNRSRAGCCRYPLPQVKWNVRAGAKQFLMVRGYCPVQPDSTPHEPSLLSNTWEEFLYASKMAPCDSVISHGGSQEEEGINSSESPPIWTLRPSLRMEPSWPNCFLKFHLSYFSTGD